MGMPSYIARLLLGVSPLLEVLALLRSLGILPRSHFDPLALPTGAAPA
jgi:hypothetical protein